MTPRTRRTIMIHVLKPLWEICDLVERLPQSIPNDMGSRVAIGLTMGAIAATITGVAIYVQLGYITTSMVALLIQQGLLGSAFLPLLGFAQGLRTASKQAALEAGEWKKKLLASSNADVKQLEQKSS